MARRRATRSRSFRGAETGKQEPQVALEPSYAYTDGGDAAELTSAYGFDLDPWQQTIINSWLGRDASDHFTATSAGLSVPRQNGKNALLEVRELYGVVCMGEKILHTAHEVKTARKAFLRLASFFENERQYPELAEEVKIIRRTNGQEAIELWNGGSIEFSARSRGAARGFTVDTVVFDEAQELTDEQVEALLPTLAAAPSGNRQFIYTGTPPSPTCVAQVFRRTREVAHAGTDDKMCWHEWSIEELPKDTSPENLIELAYETNPAMGYRITDDFVRKEAMTMSIDGFCRERLGWWSTTGASNAIPEALWASSAAPKEECPTEGKKAFGVKFSPDGSMVVLSVCRLPLDAPAWVECIGVGTLSDGLKWLTDFLCTEEMEDTTAAIAIDGKNGAGALLEKLQELYSRRALMLPGTKGVIDAAVILDESLRDGSVKHWDGGELDSQAALNESALHSMKRKIGSDGGWSYGGDTSAIIESVALALWAAKTTTRDPDGGCVIL